MSDVTCPSCGREYRVSWISLPARDRDSQNCACGHELNRWNSSTIPFYELVSEPTKTDKS